MIKKNPQTLLDVLWGWRSKTTLAKTHCFDISRMLLPQDLCICSFCLLPGIAGLAPSLGQVCFKHHLNINSLFIFLPSFLIDLTLLYFSLFHLLLPYFSHVLYPGVSFNVQEAQLVKLLACLFTPPQENGLIYLIGLLGKNKMGVFGSLFFFFFPLGGVSPSKAGERTCSTYALCDSVGKFSSIWSSMMFSVFS